MPPWIGCCTTTRTAQIAARSVARWPRPAPEGPAPAHAPELSGRDVARAWLRTEFPNLDAAFTHASTHGLDHRTIDLAAGLFEILRIEGLWTRTLHIDQAAVRVAERLGRPADYAAALIDLARVRYVTGNYPEAADALDRALEASRRVGAGRLDQSRQLVAHGQDRLGQVAVDAELLAQVRRGQQVVLGPGDQPVGPAEPALRRDPDQGFAPSDHGLPVLVPVRVLPGDAAQVLDQRPGVVGRVDRFGRAVHLRPGAAKPMG